MVGDVERIISEINQGIAEVNRLISENETPTFEALDEKLNQFTKEIDSMSPADAKEYAPLLKTWADEIRNISEILKINRDQVAGQISSVSSSGKASGAYGAASTLVKNDGYN